MMISFFQPDNQNDLDLIHLSDHFRRSGRIPLARKDNDREIFCEIVDLTRQVGVLSTHWDGSYSSGMVGASNENILGRMARTSRDILLRANDLNFTNIILPFSYEMPSTSDLYAKLQDINIEDYVLFRENEYDRDLSDVGAIKPEMKTILDEGLRGICHYNQDLRYTWDRVPA